jgi:flagellar biosynthesis protein FlhG
VNDQAARLRRLKLVRGGAPAAGLAPPARALWVTVTSGKGGVGKSAIAANLALALAELNRRTLLVDADLALANADLLLGLSPERRIDDVLLGECALGEILVEAAPGLVLLPASSGVQRLAALDDAARRRFLWELQREVERHDVIVADTASGLAPTVTALAAAADLSLVVTTPEPTALTDAYALVKILARERPETVALVVNRAAGGPEADATARRLRQVAARFLGLDLPVFGRVPEDPALERSVRLLEPVLKDSPLSPAARAIRAMARKLLSIGKPRRDGKDLVVRLQRALKESFDTCPGS